MLRTPRCLVLIVAQFVTTAPTMAQTAASLRPTCYAVRDAKVVVEPGTVLSKATVVVRDGLIAAVGADVAVPPDAAVIDGASLTVYPGFIDASTARGFDPALRRSQAGPPAAEDLAADPLVATKPDHRKGLTPEFAVQTALTLDDDTAAPWRRVGFTAHLVAPDGGFLSGTSALVSLSGAAPREAVLRGPVALHAAFGRVPGGEYPVALMGAVSHCRQTFLDAGWLKRRWAAFEQHGRTGKRPVTDPCLEALWPCLEGKLPVAFEADTADQINRALEFATEFNLRPVIVGGRSAWKVADKLKAGNVPVILRLDFPEPAERESELPVRVREDRERVRKEEIACAAALNKAGVKLAFTTQGLAGDRAERFRENLRKVIVAGLPADAALASLTRDAAEILGAPTQLGKIARGRPAHLLVTAGDFNAATARYRYAFADGVRFDLTERTEGRTADAGAAGPGAGGPGRFGRRGQRMQDPDTTPPATRPMSPMQPATGTAAAQPGGRGSSGPARPPAPPFAADAFRALVPMLDAVERELTEVEADRTPKVKTGGDVLIRNATVITVAGKTLPKADIFVRKGKIEAIGSDLTAPDGVKTLDADGLFVMPGIIDTHSHFAISGGVNEMSLSVVPEVRVRDVIDSEDVQIYRALGGGVTTARLLHGSANVVGGQDAVVKMKYGRPGTEMLVPGAPRGVKFALGENVKRTDGRFPNSRLGVEAVLVRAFTEAKAYRKAWDEYTKNKDSSDPPAEPRRDLRLEALADVLSGDLRIHSHCYRADEILMLLRVADQFGVKVRSLQHVLEGYKVAPEIVAHGASVSLFSDWWAYKVEAWDAIPYAARLLQDAGANVCLKSDDNELMRHLYQEAAKLVKYGGLTPDEAIRTITLNPAKQLGLDARLGTIEVGKDADLAIFNGHPLNAYSRCEMTLVEGEVFFQRADKLVAFAAAKELPGVPPVKFEPIAEVARGTPYLLRGATIHPPGKKPFAGSVVVVGREIKQVVPAGTEPDAAGAKVADVAGLHVYPGMIDAGTVLGLVEIASARETADFSEGGDFQPDLRASVGINPDSELIPVTRANGVTTVVTRPTGSVVPGQGALINLAGWVPAEMVVVDPLALHVEYPAEPRGRGFNPGFLQPQADNPTARRQREEKLNRLKELFEQARRYDAAKKIDPDHPVSPRLEALLPYARGEKPVVIGADRKADILAALKLAEELKVKPILSGGSEAWKVAAELKRRDVPVILGPVMSLPREMGDRYDASYSSAATLYKAGVRFCIRSAGTNNTRNLPYEAAMAVAYGLPPEEGLKAVTVYPAEILGVVDRLGTIDPGKRANLVVTTGDILQPSTQVLALFIDGRPYEPTSKQTRLYDRYRHRLEEVRSQSGKAAGEGGPRP
jgi:imidazolonepropionase-like amidohydrolase